MFVIKKFCVVGVILVLCVLMLVGCVIEYVSILIKFDISIGCIFEDRLINVLFEVECKQICGQCVWCVFFVCDLLGIDFYGNVKMWWVQVKGCYICSNQLQIGLVMSFVVMCKNLNGYVVVVFKMLLDCQVWLDYINWQCNKVLCDMLVVDVFKDNDWLMVWLESVLGQFGL